jgi:hypothetical protein
MQGRGQWDFPFKSAFRLVTQITPVVDFDQTWMKSAFAGVTEGI